MRIYMNFTQVKGPYGGANAFLGSLRRWLERHGVSVTTDVTERFDVALLNALANGLDVSFVRRLADRGIPVLHRKVGYRVSGSAEMRRAVNGVVLGDRLQIDFTPYVTQSIFQSRYSRDVFLASGFDGPFSVVYNGVDEAIFNHRVVSGLLRRGVRPRTLWNPSKPLRVIISTWSTDLNKGFLLYREVDRGIERQRNIEVWLVGRTPPNVRFRQIRVWRPRAPARLASLLKRAHVILQLAQYETCSNALIEGINCGLAAIYLDSGSNKEIAGCYGVEYTGDWRSAIDGVKARYDEVVGRTESNPFRLSVVGPQYLALLQRVAST